MLETLDYTIRIGSTPTFLYLDKGTVGIEMSATIFSYKNIRCLVTEVCVILVLNPALIHIAQFKKIVFTESCQ